MDPSTPWAPMVFEEYARARLPALLRYAAALTGDRELAQDVVQEVLGRVHARWPRISRMELPDPYIRRMIVNEFLSWRRRWGRLVPVGTIAESSHPAAAVAPPDLTSAHAERDAMLAELARLPRRQQAVLVLRYYQGLSDAEIAGILGCRPGTVRGYASRALAALRVQRSHAVHRDPQPAIVTEEI